MTRAIVILIPLAAAVLLIWSATMQRLAPWAKHPDRPLIRAVSDPTGQIFVEGQAVDFDEVTALVNSAAASMAEAGGAYLIFYRPPGKPARDDPKRMLMIAYSAGLELVQAADPEFKSFVGRAGEVYTFDEE